MFDYTALGLPPPAQKGLGLVRAAAAKLQGAANGFFTRSNVDFGIFLTLVTEGMTRRRRAPRAWPAARRTARRASASSQLDRE